MFALITFAAIAIGISFVCSVLEAALLSITPSFIAQLEEKKPKLHKKILNYKQNIDTPLAAILTLNTIAHTVGAAGVGAQVAAMYGQAYLGWASGIMTIAILVLSEILPKSIGAKYWRNLIPLMSTILTGMIFVLKPFLYISDWIMGMFNNSTDSSTVRDEIKALAKIGKKEHIIDDNKFRMINNILNLHEVKVKDVMTPRTVVHSVPPGMTIHEFDRFLTKTPFSRFPIINEKKQLFLGYIHKSSSYKALDMDKVEKYAHPMQSFYSEAKLENTLSSMLDEQTHMGLVIDQSGTWIGIITLEDIIETILGKEIVDETDIVPDMRLYAKMKWMKKQEKKA